MLRNQERIIGEITDYSQIKDANSKGTQSRAFTRHRNKIELTLNPFSTQSPDTNFFAADQHFQKTSNHDYREESSCTAKATTALQTREAARKRVLGSLDSKDRRHFSLEKSQEFKQIGMRLGSQQSSYGHQMNTPNAHGFGPRWTITRNNQTSTDFNPTFPSDIKAFQRLHETLNFRRNVTTQGTNSLSQRGEIHNNPQLNYSYFGLSKHDIKSQEKQRGYIFQDLNSFVIDRA